MTIILNHDCDCAACRCPFMCGERVHTNKNETIIACSDDCLRDAVDSFDDFAEVESFRDNFQFA